MITIVEQLNTMLFDVGWIVAGLAPAPCWLAGCMWVLACWLQNQCRLIVLWLLAARGAGFIPVLCMQRLVGGLALLPAVAA